MSADARKGYLPIHHTPNFEPRLSQVLAVLLALQLMTVYSRIFTETSISGPFDYDVLVG